MTKRSFESINYMLRPNKNVERKLIASTLTKLSEEFPISKYRYVGFGSMWFTDFILMHKVVGIDDMVTIESQKSRSKRVDFNKPFACIKVRMESAATALGAVIDDKPALVWLDYDGGLKDAMTGDLETAIGAMVSGSMILVSVNAMVDQLRGHKDGDGIDIAEADYLADICEDNGLRAEANRLTRNDFPLLVSEILHATLKSAVLKLRPGCEYVPVWTFGYADDAEMITVGGMVADATDQAKLAECAAAGMPYSSPVAMFRIELPTLTDKEKRALDKLLPSATALDYKKLDFELRPTEVEAYQRFYLQYPIFNEISA